MKILLATDGSEYSENAAQFLTRIDWTPEDVITVFHAIYEIPFHYDQAFYLNTLRAVKKEIAPKIIDTAAAILKPVRAGICGEIEESSPLKCTPEQCILNAAEASGTDLIVMGARGIKGTASLFLGSVTRLVTLHSPRPVLVVKPATHAPSGPIKILLAVDGSGFSRAAEECLAAVPFPAATEITVMHVVASSFSDIPDRFAAEIDERIKKVVADARAIELRKSEEILEQAKDRLGKRYQHVSVLSRVGDPSMEILSLSKKLDADIIALGSRGARGVKGLLGSVSKNILTHAACSVLTGTVH